MAKVVKRLQREHELAHKRRKIEWVIFIIVVGGLLIWLLKSCAG